MEVPSNNSPSSGSGLGRLAKLLCQSSSSTTLNPLSKPTLAHDSDHSNSISKSRGSRFLFYIFYLPFPSFRTKILNKRDFNRCDSRKLNIPGKKRRHDEITPKSVSYTSITSVHDASILKSKEPCDSIRQTFDFKVPVSTTGILPKKTCLSNGTHDIEEYSGFRLKSRLFAQNDVQNSLRSRQLLSLSQFASSDDFLRKSSYRWSQKPKIRSDFVIICVVCHIWRMNTPVNQSGDSSGKSSAASSVSHVFWKLTDLKRTSAVLNVQGGIEGKFGDVIAILNPKIVHSNDGDGVLLQVTSPNQVCIIGKSLDIGICQYNEKSSNVIAIHNTKQLPKLQPILGRQNKRKEDEGKEAKQKEDQTRHDQTRHDQTKTDQTLHDQKPNDQLQTQNQTLDFQDSSKSSAVCPNFIDSSIGQYCEYHMFYIYKKNRSNRMVFNDAGGGVLSRLGERAEAKESSIHLSTGTFAVGHNKWKITNSGLALASNSSTTKQSINPEHIENISKHCSRGGRNLKMLVQGVDPLSADEPEERLRLLLRAEGALTSSSSKSSSTVFHPNSIHLKKSTLKKHDKSNLPITQSVPCLPTSPNFDSPAALPNDSSSQSDCQASHNVSSHPNQKISIPSESFRDCDSSGLHTDAVEVELDFDAD